LSSPGNKFPAKIRAGLCLSILVKFINPPELDRTLRGQKILCLSFVASDRQEDALTDSERQSLRSLSGRIEVDFFE
jgi:hypothetical protein